MTGITTIGNDKSYYHGLLHIDNTDQNVTSADEVSFRLNDSDTILINKDKNPTISLVPQLYRVKGLISEVIPYNEISGVLFTYSYYDNEVLVTTNTNIDYYSQAGDQTDILSVIGLSNPVYIKCSVQFTYRSNTIQQGFELYFLSNSLYTSIQSNQNYYVSGYIDTQNGQVAEQKCGCLLLTNLYDIYKTIEVVENNQTVVKGIADIVPNTKVRMGNLTGIHNYTFGKNQPRGYGLYGESVYLTGNFYLNNGRSLVDIDRDILLAVGNIKEVERYLESLESSIRATIEANSIITEANYTGAISVNNNALLRLGLDYSLWALGNAGIVLMNPNATYNADGEVEPSTVGNGDESILLQGNKIMFATNKTFTYNNVKYYEMICTQSSPTGWTYNGSIYNPQNVQFFVLYISESSFSSINNSTYRRQIDRLDGNTTEQYLKYVGFSSISDIGTTENNVTIPTLFSASNSPTEYYLFNNYFEYPESSILTNNIFFVKKSDNTLESYTPSTSIYMNQRIIDSGVFRDGHLRVKNLVAVESGNENLNFDPEIVISDNNHPVTGSNNYTNGTNVPFVVVSGTNGKITTQGMDLKEATIGNPNDKHIHITDNTGIYEDQDDCPGMYIKSDTERTIAKFTGNNDNIFNNFTETSVNLNGSSSFDILSDLIYVNRVQTTSPIQFNIFNGGDNSNLTLKNLIFICKLSNPLRISDINVASVEMYKQNMYANTYTDMSTNVSIDNNTVIANPQNPNDTYIVVIQLNSFTLDSNISISKTLSSDDINDIKIIGWDESNSNNQIYAPLDSLYYSLRIQSITSETLIVYTTDTAPSLNSDISTIQYQTNQPETPQTETLSRTFSLLKNSTINISGSIDINFRNANPLEWDNLSNNPLIIKNNNKNYRLSPHIAGSYCITLELYLDNSLIQSWQYVQNILRINKRIGTTAYPQLIFDEVNHFGTVKLKDYLIDVTSGNHTLLFVASYSFEQSGSLNDYKSYDVGDLTGQETIVCDSFGQCHASYTNSDVTIDDNATYYWEPLLCPSQYSLHPGLTVDISSMNINLVTPKTIVQSNGFITGFNNSNYFGQCFNSGQFKFDYIINDFGQTLNNSEWNYHILENKIPVSIPILQGTVLYDSFKRSYDFNGTSLINVQTVQPSSIMTKEIYSNDMTIYSPGGLAFIEGLQSIRDGRINYNYKYDLYFQTVYHSLNQYGSGRCNILFGYKWEKLFRSYGTNVFVQVFGKYSNDGNPITAHLFYKHTNSIYFFDENNNRIKGNECIEDVNTNDFVLNYLLGIQINLYELNQQFTDGNFDIMIYYTPNF